MSPLQDSTVSFLKENQNGRKDLLYCLQVSFFMFSDLFYQKIKTISSQLLITIHFSFNDVVSLNACSKGFFYADFQGIEYSNNNNLRYKYICKLALTNIKSAMLKDTQI